MDCQIWSGSLPLGSLTLADEPAPVGWLQPTLAYERLLGRDLRRACARLRAGNFRLSPAEMESVAADLAPLLAPLVLMTADGRTVHEASIDLWDDGPTAPGPFVLIHFGMEGAGRGARLAERPPDPLRHVTE